MDMIEHVTQTRVEYCSVCGDQADGYHYGVLSCRGCNAFFRRAITYNLQFKCRHDGNCVIDRNARCACRACRLKKCKMVGMDRSAVQIRHDKCGVDSRRPNSSASEPHLSESSTCVESSPHTEISGTVIGSPGSAFTPISPAGSCIGRTPLLSTSSLAPAYPIHVVGSSAVLTSLQSTFFLPSPDTVGYLPKLMEEYFDQRRRRRSMLCSTLEEVLSEDLEAQLHGPAAPDDISAVYQVQMILMFEWVEKLAEFQQIADPHDKARLLRAFSIKYLLLDNIFYTLELGYSDRIVLPNNTFIRSGYLPFFNPSIASFESQKALSMIYSDESLKVIDEVLQPMIDMNITFGELLVLRLIILWNPGSIGLSPETCDIIQKASEKALQELHSYLEVNKISGLRSRLGNVLLLLSPLSKHTQQLIEMTATIPGFGVLPEWDSFMNDLLRTS